MARHETPDLRDRLEYAALAGLLACLRAPSRPLGGKAGMGLGRLVARAVPLRREVAFQNLRRAFPDLSGPERTRIHRTMCENLGLVLADFARFGRRRPEPLSKLIEIENHRAVVRALERKRGALLLTAHFGNWEVLGAGLAQMGYPVHELGGRQRNPLVEDLLSRYRRNMGVRPVTVGTTLRPVLEALDANACVATLADQDGGREGFFIEFLGSPASVQAGLFRLAARRGVPLVIGFSYRRGTSWHGVIADPVWPEPAGGKEGAEGEALRLATLYIRRVEEEVRRRPDHWFWLHRRWRTRPEGAAAPAGPGTPAASRDLSRPSTRR